MLQRSTLIYSKALLCALAALLALVLAPAGVAAQEEVDHVALAAVLIRDGHYDRAEIVLSEVNLKDKKVDLPRYHTLRGVISLQHEQHAEAIGHFRDALKTAKARKAADEKAPEPDPALYLYIAQAHYNIGQNREALVALDEDRAAVDNRPTTWLLRSRCLWKLEQWDDTWQVLREAYARFPKHHDFLKHQVFLLVEMDLFQEAVQKGHEYLKVAGVNPDAYVAIGEALIQAGQSHEAVLLLEEARLRFPDTEDVAIRLAHAYLKSGMNLAAAGVFEDLAHRDSEYAHDAAELYRKAGYVRLAFYFNAQVVDQKKKLRQTVSLLVEGDRFSELLTLRSRLDRLGLLEDEEIAYAMAYGYYRSRRYGEAETFLKRVQRPDLYNDVIALREAMSACTETAWGCQ